ncbi:TPA: P2 family phage major capsid protein [Serratia fonticola]
MAVINAPAVAERYHQNLMKNVTFPYGHQRTFTISDVAENKLRITLLESGWMMKGITLMDVDMEKGQAIEIGDASLHTGRSIEGRFSKELMVNGTDYVLVETDSCASLPYAKMSAIANVGGMDHFAQSVSEFFGMAVTLDMLRIGLNGERIAYPTDPQNNTKGQDVNIGWHAIAKAFNNGSQVMTEAVSLGEGGDFPHLDALANHLIMQNIPEGFREDPRLVVMVGAELAAAERLRLFNAADRPADMAAAQMLTSSVAGRFAFVPPFMPGKRLAITTLDNLHIYTQKGSRHFRAEFVDDSATYEQGYWRNEGYALGNGFLYTAVDENAVSLVRK